MNYLRGMGLVVAWSVALWARADSELVCFATRVEAGAAGAVACSARTLVYTSQLMGDAALPVSQQASSLLARMKTLLRDAGHGEAQPLRLEWVLSQGAAARDIEHAMQREFSGRHKPATSLVQGGIGPAGIGYALNGIYALPATAKPVKVEVKPVGQACVATLPAGGTTYVSGQSEQGRNTKESALLTLRSLMRTLAFLKLGRDEVVQFKVFLQPIAEKDAVLAALEEIYERRPAVPPVVFVEWLGQPSLEIELVAASSPPAGAPTIEYLTPPGMTTPTVYCRVVRVNSPGRIFFSTLTVDTIGDANAQAEDLFGQLARLLSVTGSSFEHLAKATYYVSDDAASKALNELRPRFYNPQRPPAASKATVLGTAVPGRTLALDMIAVPVP